MYILLTIQISKEPASPLILPAAIAAMFLMSQNDSQAVVSSVNCRVCLLASTYLQWNSMPFVIYPCSHSRTRIASRICSFHQPKQQLNDFQKMKSLWAKSFTPTTWHSMHYHAPMPHHTQRNWQGRLIVIGHTLISSEWYPHHCTQSNFQTMMLILIPFLESPNIPAGHCWRNYFRKEKFRYELPTTYWIEWIKKEYGTRENSEFENNLHHQ